VFVIGAYPKSIDRVSFGVSAIDDIRMICNQLFARSVSLHLLPFYISDGDGGFAPSDTFAVDEKYGSWADVCHLANERKLILDGVFNHVGINHPWAQGAMHNPEQYKEILHLYQGELVAADHLSPRGGSAIKYHPVNAARWSFWQTFSDSAIDVRLESPTVRAWVEQQLAFYRSLGVWGIRLDAAAYYGKAPGEQQLHHPRARLFATDIARRAQSHGLSVMAQLDCDDRGQSYFKEADVANVPIMDFAYTAYLLIALLLEDPLPLAAHLRKTSHLSHRLVRTPRNHDGILLRPRLLLPEHRSVLIDAAKDIKIQVRESNGSAYEINGSLPYLLSQVGGEVETWKRVFLSIVCTASLPGTPYYYLPSLLGDTPECRGAGDPSDPRSVNRAPIEFRLWKDFCDGPYFSLVHQILTGLQELFDVGPRVHTQIPLAVSVQDSVLILSRPDIGINTGINFSSSRSVQVSGLTSASLRLGGTRREAHIEPLEFACWEVPQRIDAIGMSA
jgi:sucrose phosphorylase